MCVCTLVYMLIDVYFKSILKVCWILWISDHRKSTVGVSIQRLIVLESCISC